MASPESKQRFLASPAFGVVGASKDRSKFGNRVLRKYLQHGMTAYAVNPKESEIEGQPSYSDLSKLPPEVQSLSIVTPPAVTEDIVRQAIKKGIPNLWMQPGAESPAAIRLATDAGLNLIADGSCILVEPSWSPSCFTCGISKPSPSFISKSSVSPPPEKIRRSAASMGLAMETIA